MRRSSFTGPLLPCLRGEGDRRGHGGQGRAFQGVKEIAAAAAAAATDDYDDDDDDHHHHHHHHHDDVWGGEGDSSMCFLFWA